MPSNVADQWDNSTPNWNSSIIATLLSQQAQQAILQVPKVTSQEDFLRWTPNPKGICTAKEAYKFLHNQNQVHLPIQGSRSVTEAAMQILHRTWKHRELTPCIKTFTWRLIRRALATGERAGSYSSHIGKHCSDCGQLETDAHLFFHCEFARAVWFTSNPLRTTNLPQEQDAVQEILATLIQPHTPDELLQKILTTLRYIWKARNDKRFNSKS